MSTQQSILTVSSSSHGGVKAWLYNNYVHDKNAAATGNDIPPSLLSLAQFDRTHLAPMVAGFTLASVPRQLKEPSLSTESEAQSGAILPPQTNATNLSDEISGPEGSMQHAHSESSSDDYSMFDPETEEVWYIRVRGLSFSSAYEETRLENSALEGYNADVEDNDFTDSEAGSLVSDESSPASTTETSWSDSQDDETGRKCAGSTPPSKRIVNKIEAGPIIRAWTKQMDHKHARERQIAWTCAAWAFRWADESKGCYAVLKGRLRTLRDRQEEVREALVRDIETWRAFDAALEAAL
jgi:hypothetical protein